jgi:hypothetical protein
MSSDPRWSSVTDGLSLNEVLFMRDLLALLA